MKLLTDSREKMKRALFSREAGSSGPGRRACGEALSSRLGCGPDLVVGASVGSLNGYAIAGGASPEDLCAFWMRPEVGRFRHLPETIRMLMERHPLQLNYALTLTDLAA